MSQKQSYKRELQIQRTHILEITQAVPPKDEGMHLSPKGQVVLLQRPAKKCISLKRARFKKKTIFQINMIQSLI